MSVRVGRALLAALVAEILGIVVLVALVALFGPHDASGSRQFAERLGAWVGPVSGFVLCALGGWWTAKGSGRHAIANGLAMGCAGALLDVASAVALRAPLSALLVASNLGRIVAGLAGGVLAARTSGDRAAG